MVVRISTSLNTSAERAWVAVKQTVTLTYVTRGLLGFARDAFPEEWREGAVVQTRLFLFGLIPLWVHELRLVRVDDANRELYTNERGGVISEWNHLIRVEPQSGTGCRYTDRVEIKAGLLTPVIWLYAQIFYRYRQMRWHGLARHLS